MFSEINPKLLSTWGLIFYFILEIETRGSLSCKLIRNLTNKLRILNSITHNRDCYPQRFSGKISK